MDADLFDFRDVLETIYTQDCHEVFTRLQLPPRNLLHIILSISAIPSQVRAIDAATSHEDHPATCQQTVLISVLEAKSLNFAMLTFAFEKYVRHDWSLDAKKCQPRS